MSKFIKHLEGGFKISGHNSYVEISHTRDGVFSSTNIMKDDLRQVKGLLNITQSGRVAKARKILKKEILNMIRTKENNSHYMALIKVYNLLE